MVTIRKGNNDIITRRYSRSLAIAARESVPPETLIDYLLAWLAGHGQARMVRTNAIPAGYGPAPDDEFLEWCVVWPDRGEIESSPEQKQWAWLQLKQAGYGLPAQSIHIEGDIRSHVHELTTTIDYGRLPPSSIDQIRQLIRQQTLLLANTPQADSNVQQSSLTEQPGDDSADSAIGDAEIVSDNDE